MGNKRFGGTIFISVKGIHETHVLNDQESIPNILQFVSRRRMSGVLRKTRTNNLTEVKQYK